MRRSSRRTHVLRILAITITSCLIGCQSTPRADFKTEPRKITITTEPQGATVYQMDVMTGTSTRIGVSPIIEQPVVAITTVKMHDMPMCKAEQLMKVAGGNIYVRIEKDGYETYRGYLATQRDAVAAHQVTLYAEQNSTPDAAGGNTK